MKNLEKLSKYYDRLTSSERLNLVLAAKARGDRAEVTDLVNSCPTRHYACTDAAYTDKYERVMSFCDLFISGWIELTGKAAMCAIKMLQLRETVRVCDDFGMMTMEKGFSRSAKQMIYDKIGTTVENCQKQRDNSNFWMMKYFSCLKTLVEALHQVCGENGINPDYLLQYLTKTGIFKAFSFEEVADEPIDEKFLSQIKEAF